MTIFTQVDEQQAEKAATVNEILDAVVPANLFGRKADACSGLTWGYYGGFFLVEGSPSVVTLVPDGTLTLVNGQNHIEATTGGVIQNRSGSPSQFTSGKIPLYDVTCSGGLVTSYTDRRMFKLQAYP